MTSETLDIILVVLSALFVASEVLAEIPQVRANSIFRLMYNLLAAILRKKTINDKDI